MLGNHDHQPKTTQRVRMLRLAMNEVVVIREFAACLAASIETWLAARALTMESQQAKTFSRVRGRRLPASQYPDLKNFLAQAEEIGRDLRRRFLSQTRLHLLDPHLDLSKMRDHLVFDRLRRTLAHRRHVRRLSMIRSVLSEILV